MDAWVGYIQRDNRTEDVATGATPGEALSGARAAAVRRSLDGRVLAFCARRVGTPPVDPRKRLRALASRFTLFPRRKNSKEPEPAKWLVSDVDTHEKRSHRRASILLEQEFLRLLGYGASETSTEQDHDDDEVAA